MLQWKTTAKQVSYEWSCQRTSLHISKNESRSGREGVKRAFAGLQAVHSLSSDVTIVYCKMIYKVTILAVLLHNVQMNVKTFFFLAELKVCKITKS